jgi:hypothetical protein
MKSIGVAVMLTVLCSIGATAQQDAGTLKPAATRGSEYSDVQNLSISKKLSKATAYLKEMKSALGHVLILLKEAREEKDVIKTSCINEKLTNIKGLIRISEQADILLQENAAKGEKDAASHEFQKIYISSRKIRTLRTEAEQCVGELAFAVGKTKLVVEKDKDMVPEDDPTDEDLPDTPVIRPADVSRFR